MTARKTPVLAGCRRERQGTDPMENAKRSIELIFSPLGIVVIVLSLGIVLSMAKRYSRAGHRFLFCGALLFLSILLSPLAQYLMWNLERQFPPLLTPPAIPKIERIAILAGYAEEHPGIPITSDVSDQTLGNMSEGLRLYRLAPNTKLIVSGGVVEKGKRSVAAGMADFLQQMGVSKENLIVEGNSQNTYENLREIRKLVGTAPFILVASACDLRRAVAVARKLQMNPIPAPACIRALQKCPRTSTAGQHVAAYIRNRGYISLNNLRKLQWAYHEYVGYIWYRLLGRI
jgi:uncharacterized SAM-binding protein YcdF (DUF218 family)